MKKHRFTIEAPTIVSLETPVLAAVIFTFIAVSIVVPCNHESNADASLKYSSAGSFGYLIHYYYPIALTYLCMISVYIPNRQSC